MRRRLLGVLVAAVVVVDLLVLWVAFHERQGLEAWQDAAPGVARARFERAQPVAVVERWVAAYDVGTAALADGDQREAVAQLRDARRWAPPHQVCRVSLNLALALEASVGRPGADADADAVAEARAVLLDAQCEDGSSVGGREAAADGRTLAANAREVLARLEAREQEQPPEEEQPPAQAELERRNDRAERAREKQRQRQEAKEAERDNSADTPAPAYGW